ncbi:hypothetical protein bmyco0003_33150 [Bacillus pseudomycoides]|nr:hypothetical protein bmyco0002_31890 [Bacillus pseudomycoides]EEM09890.1 hypothetical protein bmyco0003_33150 [Bacillus pseudomycoides]EEM15680.1 hypothetical protein bpmyx0001_34500 [Bacillus pseudomycoides DSM 12442]
MLAGNDKGGHLMYGYTYCYPTCSYPSYGYGGSCGGGSGRGFALIVVLFILLIIVGAACIR